MPRTACGLSLIHQGDENTDLVHQQQLGWHLERCSVLEASRLKSPDDLELQLSRARGNAHVVGRHACCCDGSSLQLCQLCLQLGHILPDALQPFTACQPGRDRGFLFCFLDLSSSQAHDRFGRQHMRQLSLLLPVEEQKLLKSMMMYCTSRGRLHARFTGAQYSKC